MTYAEDTQQNAQQQNVRDIARRLDPTRFEITLLCEHRELCSIASHSHVRLLHLPRRLRAVRIFWALLTGSYDILLQPQAGLPERLYCALPRWFPGRSTRVVVSVEGDQAQLDEVPRWIRHRVQRLYLRADVLVSITEYVRTTLEARVGKSGPVIPVGVDLERFQPREAPRRAGPVRVLCVGTVKAWKRPEFARLAAEQLPEVSFRWLGAGDLLASQRAEAPSNLEFVGAVDHRLLPEEYRDADVLLHPSRMEGMPKAILEALASGIPVIAFENYRPDYLTAAGAGFVVGGPAEMVTRLRQIAEDEDLRRSMGAAARDLASGFSWDLVAAKWAHLFEEQSRLRHRDRA